MIRDEARELLQLLLRSMNEEPPPTDRQTMMLVFIANRPACEGWHEPLWQ